LKNFTPPPFAFIALASWTLAAWTLTGCISRDSQPAFQLRELSDSIRTELACLQTPSDAASATAFAWTDDQLREFRLLLDEERVEISKQEGQIISDVSRARRLLKDQAQRRSSLPKAAERAMSQLTNLANALSAGATHDANGDAMDSAYIAKEMKTEIQIARDLVRALQETQDLAIRGIRLRESIASSSDSLQTVLRSRLAKAILGSEPNVDRE